MKTQPITETDHPEEQWHINGEIIPSREKIFWVKGCRDLSKPYRDNPIRLKVLREEHEVPAIILTRQKRKSLEPPYFAKQRLRIIKRWKGRKVVELPEGISWHDSRYNAPNNPWHLIHQILPPLMTWGEITGEPFGLVVEKTQPYTRQILETLNIQVVETQNTVKGTILDYKNAIKVGKKITKKFREIYHNQIKTEIEIESRPAVFLVRRKTRTIKNEEEIAEILKAWGYQTICFEKCNEPWVEWIKTGKEQLEIMAQAKRIVSIHGAGMAGIVGGRNQRIIEIFPPGYTPDCFAATAELTESKWIGVIGATEPINRDNETLRNLSKKSFRVDPECLKLALEEITDFKSHG